MSDDIEMELDRKLADHLEDQRIPSSEEIAVMYERLTHRPFEPVRNREDSPPLTLFEMGMILLAALVLIITIMAVF